MANVIDEARIRGRVFKERFDADPEQFKKDLLDDAALLNTMLDVYFWLSRYSDLPDLNRLSAEVKKDLWNVGKDWAPGYQEDFQIKICKCIWLLNHLL